LYKVNQGAVTWPNLILLNYGRQHKVSLALSNQTLSCILRLKIKLPAKYLLMISTLIKSGSVGRFGGLIV